MKKINKIVSILLSLALLCSTMALTLNVSAETENNNLIVNGDFSKGLTGYKYSTNTSNAKLISVSDGVCYIPERTNDAYNRWINQKVSLANGTYTFSFDLDITYTTGTQYEFAYAVRLEDGLDNQVRPATDKKSTYCTLSTPELEELANVLNANGDKDAVSLAESSFRHATTQDYFYHVGEQGKRYVGKVTVDVEVNNPNSSKTNFYFSIGCPAVGTYAYIDNVSLKKNEGSSDIINGDFEDGETGYLYAGDENLNITVYDNADTTRPYYNEVTLDGKAAYIEGYGGGVAYAKKNNLQYKIVNLPAGKYSVTMDVLLNNIDTSAWSSFAFGVTNAFDTTNGRAYSKPIISDSAVVTENGNPVTITTSTNYHYVPKNTLVAGWHDLDVSVSFTITEATTVYFFVWCSGDGTEDTMDATAYVDNITLTRTASEFDVLNGDFSNGLKNWTYSTNTGNALISVSDGVCYFPERTVDAYNRFINQSVKLGAGEYTFSFDADAFFATAQNTSFTFGISTKLDSYTRPGTAAAEKPTTMTDYVISVEDCNELTTSEISAVSFDKTKFKANSNNSFVNYYNPASSGRFVGRINVHFTVTAESTLYFSIGCGAVNTSAYIDNVSLIKTDSASDILNGDFEEGKIGYLFADDDNTNITVYDNADTTRPGYGTVTLDGKAAYIEGYGGNIAYAKNNNLQYKILNLPAGQYSINMDVLLNQSDTEEWTMFFGVTDAFDTTNGRAYSKDIISDSVVVTENGTIVNVGTAQRCHYITGDDLTAGWHDLDVSLSFTIAEATTVYFFAFCNGGGTEDTMYATAYIDNISLYESAIVTSSYLNVKGEMIEGIDTITEHEVIGSVVSKTFSKISNYNLMGYRINDNTEIVADNIYETVAYADTDISLVYALQGDLNDDLYVNALDLTEMRKYLLDAADNCNIVGANANGDDNVDIRDLVALKKKIANLFLEDKKIVNADIEQMRDPYMLVEDDVYYLYGTGGKLYKNTSRSLSGSWQYVGIVAQTPENASDNLFWAPEVYKYNDAYYMITSYYSSVNEVRGCAVLKANSPEGPFVEISNGTITPSDKYCIDGTLYIDEENQPWLIYSEEYIEADNNVGGMYAAKLSADLTSLISDPIELFKANEASWSSGKISEGPFLYRCENGDLLMLVASFEKDGDESRYCVGVARSDNDDIDGNWSFDNTLLFSKELFGEYDGGHGMIFESLTGQLYLSVHSPNDVEGVNSAPVFVPIKEENGTLVWDVK